MPITGQTDPAALLMQRMGPAGPPGGAPAPPGGPPGGGATGGPPGFTGNAPGNPGGTTQPPQVNPQTMKLAQLAQRLLMQQQGTEQLKNFVMQIISMVKSVNASQFMQNPKASKRFATAMENLSQGVTALGEDSPNAGGPIQNAIMEMMKPALGPAGGQGTQMASGGPPQGPTPPAYPLG